MTAIKSWFVTGASKGPGLILVKQLLAAEYNVAATIRNKETLEKELAESAQVLSLAVDLQKMN